MTEDDVGTEVHQRRSEPSEGTIERILSADGESLDRLFTFLLFLFFGVLLAMVPQYSPDSRLFPLVIGVPTFVLLGILLLAQSSSRFAAILGRVSASDVFDIEERFADDDSETANAETGLSPAARRKRIVGVSLWMVLMFALVLVVGFIPASFLFMVAYYGANTDLGWPRTIGYALVVVAAIIVVFDVIMGTRLYEGVLEISIPF